MATPRLLHLSRTLLTKPTFLRSFSTTTVTSAIRPLFSAIRLTALLHAPQACGLSPSLSIRTFARQAINDNSGNRPPKETILLDGCDFEHWLVVTDPPPQEWTRDEIIDSYVKTLAEVLGSEEEARMKIYSVSTKHYFAFGALVSEEISYKLKELQNIRWVLPDSYLDVRNKDYGGEPFINGQAVPYDPKYHEEWVRNNIKAMNPRKRLPRNDDRSGNFDRRQRTAGPPSGFQNNSNPQANAERPGGNMGGMPNQPGGYPQNMPPNNAGYAQNMPPNNAGYAQNMPPNNVGYAHNNAGYAQNMPPNNAGYTQNMPTSNGGYAQNNQGFAPNMAPNNPNNMSGHPSYGGQGNPCYSNSTSQNHQGGGRPPYQNAEMGNQQNYAPQNNMGGQPGWGYQGQGVPGRDVAQY